MILSKMRERRKNRKIQLQQLQHFSAHEPFTYVFSYQFLLSMIIGTFVIQLLNTLGIFIVDHDIMNACAAIAVLLTSFALLVCIFLKEEKEKYRKVVVLITIILFTGVLGVALTYHTVLLSVLPLIYAVQYRKKRIIYLAYAGTVLVTLISVLVGYRLGVCDANMVFFTTDDLAHYTQADGTVNFGNESVSTTAKLILYFVFPRCIILGLMVPIMNHIVHTIENNAKRELRLKKMSGTDNMTGLCNRNRYKEMCEHYYPSIAGISVVFVDLNNLKKVNDEYGHDCGDSYIIKVSHKMIELMEDETAYRIGGDEFVIINEVPDVARAERFAEELKIQIMALNDTSDFPMSISVGVAIGKGINAEDVVKEADKKMYIQKKKFHGRDTEKNNSKKQEVV